MEIRGIFVAGRPHVTALLVFSRPAIEIGDVFFLIDTGADRSVFLPTVAEARLGANYPAFADYPVATGRGFGGGFEARGVPVEVVLFDQMQRPHQFRIEIDVARRTAVHIAMPSVLGRDVLDLFRLTIDRSTGLIALTDAQGDMASERWPDGALRE